MRFTADQAFNSLQPCPPHVLGLQSVASERVEVVILEPMNTDGQPHETRLWIVDDPDYQYLPTSADAGWHQPLVANPHIRVERNGQRRAYIAVPGLEKITALNQLMNSEYRLYDGPKAGYCRDITAARSRRCRGLRAYFQTQTTVLDRSDDKWVKTLAIPHRSNAESESSHPDHHWL